MGIPFELITMLGSAIIGGVLKVWGMKNETQRMQMGLLLQNRESERTSYKDAREYRNGRFEINYCAGFNICHYRHTENRTLYHAGYEHNSRLVGISSGVFVRRRKKRH